MGDPDAALKDLKLAFRRPEADLGSFLQGYLKKGGKEFKPIEDWLRPYETAVPRLWKADGFYHAGQMKEALEVALFPDPVAFAPEIEADDAHPTARCFVGGSQMVGRSGRI